MKNLRHTLHSNFTAFFAVLVISIFSCFFFSTSSASAFSLGTTRNILFDTGYGESSFEVYNGNSSGQGVGPYYNVYFSLSSDINFLTGNSNNVAQGEGGNITTLTFALNDTLPANSLFNFSVRYLTTGYSSPIEYRGQTGGNFYLLNSDCTTLAETDNNTGVTYTSGYVCTYWGYNSSNLTYLSFNPSVYFLVPIIVQTSRKLNLTPITFDSGSGSSGLTQSDRDWLALQIQSINSSSHNDSAATYSALQSILSAQNSTLGAIRAQTQQQHDDYENEVQREEDKQDELEEQSGDLSLSAQSTGNPFASLFTTNSCITLTSISSWFNVSPAIQICSPYPENIRPILTFVTSAVVVGLLIRLYYKNLKGGFAS
ncbi:MAG: hypothetical protein J6S67_26260 [Methanobrevibacter sp.]|nr:hypothetical protein [Methanobrevibacter sp.]